MWTRITPLLVFLLVAAGCTADVDSGPVEASSACDSAIAPAFEAWQAAGFSGSVAFLGGERECVSGFGSVDASMAGSDGDVPLTPETTFSIGSITKAVTAAAIAGLVEDGSLSYEDRASDHLSELTGSAGDATIEQLLLHTGGFTGNHGRDHEPLAKEEAIVAIGGLDQVSEPGSEFLYSNAGYSLLALIVDELTSGYRQYLRERILIDGDGQPLGGFWDGEPAAPKPRAVGITEAGEVGQDGSFSGPHWGLDGNGGVAMTARELAVWTRALFNGEIIGQDAVDNMVALRFEQPEGSVEIPGWVSIGSEAFGEPIFGSSGGGGGIGHEMTVAYLPSTDRVFVIASNSPDVRAEGILEQIIGPLVAGETLTGPQVASGADPATLAAVVGSWELDDGSRFDVVEDGDGIRVRPLDGPAMPVILPIPSTEEAQAHEQLAVEVLGGSTEEGKNERRLLEENLGPIQSIDIIGTWFAEFEYRTLVHITFESEETMLWLALDDAGGIAAAELGASFPSLRFLPRDDGSFAPIDQSSGDLGIRITVADMLLELENGGVTETAKRAE